MEAVASSPTILRVRTRTVAPTSRVLARAPSRFLVRASCDGDASATTELQHVLVAQHSQSAEHSVGMHAEHRGRVAGGWETFTGSYFAVCDLAADLVCDLFMKREWVVPVDIDFFHGDMHSSTMVGVSTALRDSPVIADPDALIREARRRQRRRWTAIGAVIVVAAVVTVSTGHAIRAAVPHRVIPHVPQPTRLEPHAPGSLAVGPDGGLYIADSARDQILELRNGNFRVVVGDGKLGFRGDGGPATNAEIKYPFGMTFRNGTLYFADSSNHRIRAVSPLGIITTVAGNGQDGWVANGTPALAAPLSPSALTFGPNGEMYVASDQEVLGLDANGTFTRVLGNTKYDGLYGIGGRAVAGSADGARSVAFDSSGDLYVAGSNPKILLMIDPHGQLYGNSNIAASDLITTPNGTVIVTSGQSLVSLSRRGDRTLVAFPAYGAYHGVRLFYPDGIAITPNSTIYVDTSAGNGWADKSAIVAISPNGHSTLLWEQATGPTKG
jgi:hypothetical protein